jgi:hypothetical protein
MFWSILYSVLPIPSITEILCYVVLKTVINKCVGI